MPEEYHTFNNVATATAVALRAVVDEPVATFAIVPESDRYVIEVLSEDGLTERRL